MSHIAIIGAGFTGLAAAQELVKQGIKVTIFERDAEPGGLAGSFELSPGIRLEKFYHHWFTSDRAIFELIEELGMSSDIQLLSSNTGLYYANSIFRLSTPLDLLGFSPLPLIDRIRTGLLALYARRISRWQELEGYTAEEWLIKVGGARAYEIVWKPLLVGKFGPEAPHVSAVWIWNKLKLRGGSRGKGGSEQLAYFRGGFAALTSRWCQQLVEQGAELRLNTPIERILVKDGRALGVSARGSATPADAVLATVAIPTFLPMVPELPGEFRARAEQIRYLGNVCLILRLKQSLSSTYWLNVADPSFPFVGVIEHTNLDRSDSYGGERIAYLSKYLPTTEPMYKMTSEELFHYALPYIQRMFPALNRDLISGYHVWREPYSQPVITRHYSRLIPEEHTPVKNLWLATMAQIYPEDRGTTYAVQRGREVGKAIAANLTGAASQRPPFPAYAAR